MKLMPARLVPAGLAGRFALASAGLAAVAVLLLSIASWWIIDRQQHAADERIAMRERQFHAANIASSLRAVSSRMSEVAHSNLLATALVDSAGKETYLAPFINGIRQVNGLPVALSFTDFEGQEIASNAAAHFTAQQLAWARAQLPLGQDSIAVFEKR